MKISSLFPLAAGVALAASIVAGCSSGSPAAFAPSVSASASQAAPSTSMAHLLAMTTIAKIAPPRHAQRWKKRGMPTPCSPLPWCQYWDYVDLCQFCPGPYMNLADEVENVVDEYTSTVVQLPGFNEPFGECVDAKGDTWITNFSGGSVVEYARGGTQPIAALSTNGYSIGCAVSPNGDLAVANFSAPSGSGNIEVFRRASGTPTEYSNQQDYYLFPPGYDNKGNLFVEAQTAGGGVGVAEILANDPSLEQVSVNQTIYFPGGVMWDGKYITLTDQDAGGNPSSPVTTVYQMSEQGSKTLTVVGKTPLEDKCNGSQVDVVQPFIVGRKNTPINNRQGKVIIGGNLACQNRVDAWKYPAGGQPIAVASPVPAYAYGQSVSVASK